ncbi:MAG: YebC/PmpR family DNA-binding transcriptional regulator [Candidatus Wallbacteria bacterium HGW-Wallbacteria-1]|uniref:Probable transcriptional regulatory protein CVV64_03865 n=1 Tax=Candidatus Wallbacteria bacterium HGW-Wallbacteria-1 TaxID=2013854 RepID=A0A2N1PU02_9BACT|nr:MAG: YebC/PmpR family DNA-binding transcriptional regulator [Candidatus Wallbacteria bacterium HGW-Wallbacteria-1]
MSGHNKWSTIKHKKAAKDAKRGAVFTKLIKQLQIAAREGGSDLTSNFALRTLVDKAKSVNMPNENIDRAVKRGAGELPGQCISELWYEGYGPGGTAFIVQTLTDNKNRTASEMRFMFSKNNGNLGEQGCVSWMFEKHGYFEIEADKITEETLMDYAIEAGADDVRNNGDSFEVFTDPSEFAIVGRAFAEKGVECSNSELTMVPKTQVDADEKIARQVLRLIESLEDNEDVQNVYTNANISDEIMEKLGEE